MNQEQRAALRKLAEALDQLRNGTLLDEHGNHDDDSLMDIAGNCPSGWVKSKLAAHGKRLTAANPSTILAMLDYIETLEKDAARWRSIETHWSSADIRNNRDGSFKSMTITFKAGQLSDEANKDKLRRGFDAAMQGETE